MCPARIVAVTRDIKSLFTRDTFLELGGGRRLGFLAGVRLRVLIGLALGSCCRRGHDEVLGGLVVALLGALAHPLENLAQDHRIGLVDRLIEKPDVAFGRHFVDSSLYCN